MGHRAGLDGCGKSRPRPDFDPRAVHLVASRYTDCAIPALKNSLTQQIFQGLVSALLSSHHQTVFFINGSPVEIYPCVKIEISRLYNIRRKI